MKALALGGDETILIDGSPSNRRMHDYARHLGELHIVIAARRGASSSGSGNLHLHPAPGRLSPIRWLRMLRRADGVCRAVRPDLITTQDAGVFGLAGLLLGAKSRTPLQVQVHTDIFSPHYRRASWKEWIASRLAPIVLRRASCIRVVSRRTAEAIVRRLGVPTERVSLLPIYTDVPAIRSAARQAETDERYRRFGFRLVSAGRFLEREKNFGLLLEVMAELRSDLPQVGLALVGDGPDRARLVGRITALGLEDRVWLEPWRDDLPGFLKSFDVFLLPSNFEGFPRVCVEAAAAGLALVMTDVGPAGELFVDGVSALVVPVADAPAMAAAVRHLAQDDVLRRRLARAAQESVASIGFDSAESYARVYAAAMRSCLKK